MNNRGSIKIIIPIILVILLIPMIIILGKNSNHANAENTPSYLTFENFNPKAKLGTKENPFIILEIVPSRWMGQIGYIIAGQELIEPTAATMDGINGIAGNVIINENGTYKNTEIFKKKVLNLTEEECADYHIRVVTITPDVLNKNVEKYSKYYDLKQNGNNNKVLEKVTKGEIDLIGNADLISISPMVHGGQERAIELWNSSRRDKSEPAASDTYLNFEKNDLSWQTTMELFMKVGVVDDSAVLVYDISLIQAPNYRFIIVESKIKGFKSQGFCNNFYKLLLMIRQSDPALLYKDYLKPENGIPTITHNQSVNSGSYNDFSGDAAIYWNEYTFLPKMNKTYPGYLNEEYKKYLKEIGYLISTSDVSGRCSDSVIRNAYSYNGTTSIVQSFTSDSDNIGLKEVVVPDTDVRSNYNIELFEFLDEKNGSAPRPTIAKPCEALEYLLSKKKEKYKESITVLDLEPCNDFTLTEEQVRAMLPSFTGTIRIEQQTTAEFIGKTEDINQIYDLIYIGTNTGKMKTVNGVTSYSDPMLDGYVYLHSGDRVVSFDTFKGSLRNDNASILKAINSINFKTQDINRKYILKNYNNSYSQVLLNSADFYRYSGNDITSVKRDALIEYMDAGYPILLENDLYMINKKVVDDESNLYQFLTACKSDQFKNQAFNRNDFINVTGSTNTLKSKLMKLVQKEKLSVDLIGAPMEYQQGDNSTLIVERKLPFQFVIHDLPETNSDAKYNWNIYVDANADGQFSLNESELSGNNATPGDYSCNVKLSEEYTGVVPWKLVIKQADNPKIRWSRTGFAAFKVPTMNETEKIKTQIDVLQITSNNSTCNLQELMNPGLGKTSLFYQYTKDLDDFNVSITTVSVDEFVNWYNTNGKYEASKPKTDQLKDYDMLIFGFGDCYSDISNEDGALNNVKDFIKSGRSVMFTHDTTSFVNLPKADFDNLNKDLSFWGYGINQYIRSIVGMDRFNALKQAKSTDVYDKAIMPERVSNDSVVNGIYKNFTRTTDGKLCYPEIQGLTNGCLAAYSNPTVALDSIHNLNKDYPPFTTGNTIIKGNGMENYMTTYVTKVNEGQITSYPYNIPDSFQISKTHLQYYQLNLDDPEIIVWYCLSDNKANEFSEDGNNNMNHSKETGPYSTSPNDVRNNYYIYNKGNIMYTGVGHSEMDGIVNIGKPSGYSEYEVKLFINTMIASYNAGIVPPSVEITNKDAKNNGNGYVWYQYSQDPKTLADKEEIVSFKAYDTNLSSNDLVVRIYKVKDASGSMEAISPDVYDTKNNNNPADDTIVSIFNALGQEKGHNIKADTEYYFKYSMRDFSEKGSAQIYITVTNKDNLSGNTNLKLLNRSLFDLD